MLLTILAASACFQAHMNHENEAQTITPHVVLDKTSLDYRLEFAHFLVKSAFSSCSADELGIDLSDKEANSCRYVIKQDSTSDVCYLSGEFGYYIVHLNMKGIGSVLFNRWD